MTAGTWDDERLRVYLDPREIGADGYPYAWHGIADQNPLTGTWRVLHGPGGVKHLIRELGGYRCERCGHPFTPTSPGEWSPCDALCSHGGPVRVWSEFGRNAPPSDTIVGDLDFSIAESIDDGFDVDAQWRILTVHHLNGVKHDLRWWNLAALCQRCHLTVQGKVRMERSYLGEHSEWFKPHAAGWYAWDRLGIDVSRAEALERLDELLDLEHRQGFLC